MPSFWKLLCFPKHNQSPEKRERRIRRKISKNEKREPEVPNKACSICSPDALGDDHVPNDYHLNIGQHVHKGESGRCLIEGQRPKKRRRVQDIFVSKRDEDTESVISDSQRRYYKSNTRGQFSSDMFKPKRDFGRGFTPSYLNRNSQVESMYGYVPKAVQDVYASNALEGAQIDDFFNRMHRESSLSKFCLKPGDLSLLAKTTGSSSDLTGSESEHDQVSLLLIENMQDKELSDIEEFNRLNSQTTITPKYRTINTNFDQIFNYTGEVLY